LEQGPAAPWLAQWGYPCHRMCTGATMQLLWARVLLGQRAWLLQGAALRAPQLAGRCQRACAQQPRAIHFT